MITLRKAIAITATSALAVAGLLAGSANAQSSSQVAINTSVKVNPAGAPAGVTGYNVVVNCSAPTSQQQTSSFPAAGGGPIPLFFSVSGVNSCTFQVNALPANTAAAAGAVVHNIGGRDIGPVALGDTSPAVPIIAGTNAVFSVTYPSVTVKKVIAGDEITVGTEYEMAVICYYNDLTSAGKTSFKLKAGASKTVTTTDIPGLVAGATCHAAELNTGGAASTSYSSTKADGTTASGIAIPVPIPANTTATPPTAAFNFNPFAAAGFSTVTFASGGTIASGQTITVTNSFVGDLIVSKVVTGDPKTSIAIYEINVSCNNNGPKETFLLKDRQSKVFTNINTGTSCLVSETRSDGAEATYADNSGDNTTDGRVTIKGTASGCRDANLSSFPDCRANVIVTNSYVVATTTAAATTAAPATAAPATAAPIAAAPPAEVEVLDDEEVVTG